MNTTKIGTLAMLVLLFAACSFQAWKERNLALGIGQKEKWDAKILIFSGDKLVKQVPVKNKFVFIVGKRSVGYMDTAQGDAWVTNTLTELSSEHQLAILKAMME